MAVPVGLGLLGLGRRGDCGNSLTATALTSQSGFLLPEKVLLVETKNEPHWQLVSDFLEQFDETRWVQFPSSAI